jgi:hypothetical protein
MAEVVSDIVGEISEAGMEQSTAAADNLKAQVQQLAEAVAVFKLADNTHQDAEIVVLDRSPCISWPFETRATIPFARMAAG